MSAGRVVSGILATASELLRVAAQSPLPQPWGTVLSVISAGAGLGAELIANGIEPVGAIEEFRSMIPGWKAANARLEDYLEQLARNPETARRREDT